MRPECPVSDFSYIVGELVKAAQMVQPNELWTYEAMSEAIGVKIQNGGDGRLQAAIKRLSRDHAVDLKNVRTVGYRRLDSPGIVGGLPADVEKIRRQAKRSGRKARNAEYNALSISEKSALDRHMAYVGTIELFSAPKGQKAIEGAMKVGGRLPDESAIKQLFQSI